MTPLREAAIEILETADPDEKCRRSKTLAAAWRQGKIADIGRTAMAPPDRPARPARPEIRPPNKMPRRSFGGAAGRVSLLHALAHIEFNAIDLAWDMIARYDDPTLPRAFYTDWVKVADDETDHFLALRALLRHRGADYGDLPAHDGLWDAARKTAHDLRARLAVVPMVLEARALETAPGAIERLAEVGDQAAQQVLERIYRDEIDHVAIGVRWFQHVCAAAGLNAERCFRAAIADHFPKGLKPPFNDQARAQAGFPQTWYAGSI